MGDVARVCVAAVRLSFDVACEAVSDGVVSASGRPSCTDGACAEVAAWARRSSSTERAAKAAVMTLSVITAERPASVAGYKSGWDESLSKGMQRNTRKKTMIGATATAMAV